jgi:urea transport system substrate-binding protein
MSDNDASAADPLGQIADEFVEAFRQGKCPSVEEFARRYSEHADDIREMLPVLVLMEKAKSADDSPGQRRQATAAAAPAPLQQLGDYQILREVGRGGMGIVYEAVQVSLDRRVALKTLPSHASQEGKALEQFQREARSAARLHHPNIVPIYAVGEQDGLHYYAMQFIQGLSLDEVLVELRRLRLTRASPTTAAETASAGPAEEMSAVGVAEALLSGQFAAAPSFANPLLRERPGQAAPLPASPRAARLAGQGESSAVRLPGQPDRSSLPASGRQYWQSVARVGIQVAEALAYASSQGILHRDIKPSNLMLDARGNVWVTDFGLAKVETDQDKRAPSGALAGTLSYLAPERFEGQADVRGDIYGLGLTLYELLTLRPAFEAADRHTLLAQVKDAAPPRPRQLNPRVPSDLETIVLKATARDPARRYQTPAELAEDLKRFVGDQPIQAPRVSTRERLWRWCRRSPAGAAALTAAVAVLSLALAAGVVLGLATRAGTQSAGTEQQLGGGTAGPPIKVGVLHSLSGTMISETASVEGTLLAIEEINQQGGVLGRQIEPVVVDGKSDWPTFAREAERLITREQVCTLFGCWTSASRKSVKPVVEKHDHLLIYPMQYEGLEQSPNIVYTGAAPNQQVTPAVQWACQRLGKRRFFLVGSDYIWPRASHAIIQDQLKVQGAEVVGEEYIPLASFDVGRLVDQIVRARPDIILEMIAGDSKVGFYRALRKAGITPERIPTISFSNPGQELRSVGVREMSGDYAAWNYFPAIETPQNQVFVDRFRARYGPQRLPTDPMEASYFGVHLWAQAVAAAGSDDVRAIRQAIRNQSFQAPEGLVRIDPQTQHTWKTVRIGKMTDDGQFEIIHCSEGPIRPIPYPPSRSQAEWESFLAGLYQRWGGHWANPGG